MRSATRLMRALGVLLLVAVASFALLIELAIARYPGGTWFDRAAPGHDMFRNFLCDLTQPISLSGQPNPAFGYAKAAMIALDVALLCMWLTIPRITATRGVWLRVMGLVSFAGILAVPLTPSLKFGVLHAVAVLAGAIPGIVACVLATQALARSEHRWLFRFGCAVLITSAVDAAIYGFHTATHGPVPLALPVLQRLALVLLLAWMTALAITLMRPRPPA